MSTVVSPECWWRNETRAGICWGVGGCGCAACSVQKRRSLGFPSQREVRASQKFPWWSSVHETHRWVGGMSVGEDCLCMLRCRGVHGRGGAKDGPSRRMELRRRAQDPGRGSRGGRGMDRAMGRASTEPPPPPPHSVCSIGVG